MTPTPDQMRRELAKRAPERASEALGKHEGKTLMVTQADRTKVGGGYLGGPGFSSLQHTDPAYEGKAWGVMTPGMASTITGANKRVPEGEAVWSTLIGTPEQHSSNQMVFNKLVRDFKKVAGAGLLTPDLHSKINDVLASHIDKEGKPFFEPGSDIMNPKTIKSADTFAKRRIIADLIGGKGVGGKKGQVGNYDRLMHEATDPSVRDVPTHAIGPRLFRLSNETSHRPDLHPAFPQMLHGEDYGQTYRPVPKEVMLRDYMKKFVQEKNRKPGYMDLTLGYSPTQHLSEEFLTHLQKHGYADGGGVSQDEMLAHVMLHKADGGAVQLNGGTLQPNGGEIRMGGGTIEPDRPDGTSTDTGYYEGGPSDNDGTNPMQFRAEGGSITDIGVNEAPDMDTKAYIPPGPGGMPVGGVDFQPEAPGQQFLPGQQAPQGAPGQQAPQGQPPAAGAQPPGQAPQAPQAPQGAPGQPPSNILQMTRPGQVMGALQTASMQATPVPPGMRQMPRMAKGGRVEDIKLTERKL